MSRYTSRELRTDLRHVEKLIAAARVPVFLLDEHQVVRAGELGTVSEIKAHAKSLNLAVHKINLNGQFRCGGSEAFMEWVLRLLGLAPGGPFEWVGSPVSAVRVADSPHELEHVLRASLTAVTVPGWQPFGAVGCVYTAQEFEYDWNGVVIRPDLAWRGRRLAGDARGK